MLRMTIRRRSNFSGRRGRTIDFKSWSAIPSVTITTTGAATLSGAGLSFAIPATILRMRGEILFYLDGAADTSRQVIAAAIGLISTDAFTLGSTAFPDPLADVGFPWLWYSAVSLSNDLDSVGDVIDAAVAVRLQVDSKAMRKVKPDETLVVVFQTSTAITTTVIRQGQLRVLVGT